MAKTTQPIALKRQEFEAHAIAGAHAWALANKSDPFALSRALTHVRIGICQPAVVGRNAREDRPEAIYDATRGSETRTLPEGMHFSDGSNSYQAEAWRGLVRL